MKKYVLICILAFIASSCGVSRKIEVLEKCTYNIKSADDIFLAGKNMTELFKNRTFDLSSAPGIALAMLRKNIPLKANVKLSIYNPTSKGVVINQFDYIILVKGQEIAAGTVDKRIDLVSGATTIVPVQVNSNIYSFLSNGKTMEELLEFMSGARSGQAEKKSKVSIKIRPSFMLGKELIKYPTYITIDKEISSKILY
jgi:hypothetical protein